MNRDSRESISTADLATAAEERNARYQQATQEVRREAKEEAHAHPAHQEKLAPLFTPQVCDEFRHRWDQVQFSFVDDPKRAVREGDELVAQVMKSLAQSFSQERARLEKELGQSDAGATENLRVALQRYRSFFQRLLSL
jgi:hypothetical protein